MIILPNMRELAQIQNAKTFEQCLGIAVPVLQREAPPIAMVCGPISSGGYESVEKNLAAFREYIRQVSALGLKVFSQMVYENTFHRLKRAPYCKTGEELLEAFYAPIFQYGLIKTFYFIPRWQTSMGASWEHEQAEKLGIEINYL